MIPDEVFGGRLKARSARRLMMHAVGVRPASMRDGPWEFYLVDSKDRRSAAETAIASNVPQEYRQKFLIEEDGKEYLRIPTTSSK